ncbi:unnamed protein product [Ambrosiozyma monospora]|uniref:Unnamed protein product n=1 Tax=Ambrosiozyma monospora TaxID=43982 RepID=A0A9W7DIH7_AMBMO|nr:unnamed protein product [Ambrosiozyma monospora]
MSSKGFEIDDDLEFCPDVIHGHNKFNAFTSSPVFSPQGSPSSSNNVPLTPNAMVATTTYSNSNTNANASSLSSSSSPKGVVSPVHSSGSPRAHTPRVRKVLQIVNPHTGMRIGSPLPHPQPIAQAAK